MYLSEELKEKMISAIKNNRLVGNARFTDEEYQAMCDFTRQSVLLRETDELNFVALVEISKRWRKGDGSDADESGFWEYVFSELNLWYDHQKYLGYTALISRLGRYGKIVIANSTKKYYATLMMHSFAPQRSIYTFLDLIFNVYKIDLDFNYTEADNTICDLIYYSFRQLILNMRSGEESVAIGSASYNVKVGLRCLAVNNDTKDIFVYLVNSALLYIHSFYHKREMAPTNYFEEILCAWWNNKSKDIGIPRRRVGSEPAVTKNTISVKFVRNDDKVVLRIPPIRMNYQDQSSLFVKIYCGNEQFPRVAEELKIKVGELILTSLQSDIELNKILLEDELIKFKIEISTPEKVLFSKNIDEEFILFSEKNEISSKINKPDNYFVYSRSIENLLTPADTFTYSRYLYNIYPRDGEMLSGRQKSVLFINAQADSRNEKVNLFGNLHNCYWEVTNEKYEIFSEHVNLLAANFNSINGLELFINNSGVLLSQLECSQNETQRVYNLEELMSENTPYEIVVYSHVIKKELLRVKLVYFKEFNFKFSQNVFYGNDIKSLTILDRGKVEELTWNNYQNQVEVPIRGGKIIIDIPYLKWRIDDMDWHYEPINELVWYKNIFHNGSLLELCSPACDMDMQIYAVISNQAVIVNKNSSGKFEIGKCIYSNENLRLITFGVKGQKFLKSVHLFDIATQEHFFSDPLIVEGDKIIFCSQTFVGDHNRSFKISLTKIGQEPICAFSDKLKDGIIPNIEQGVYWANISSQSEGLFAKREQIYWQGEFIFGDKDRLQLANMIYKISPLNGQGLSDSWKMLRSGYYITNLIRIAGKPDEYTAKLFYIASDKSKHLINNLDICKIEIISSIAMSILVKDLDGNFNQKLMCDRVGNLSLENLENRFPITITNYHFIEVKNV